MAAIPPPQTPKKQSNQALNQYMDWLVQQWQVDLPRRDGPVSPSKLKEVSPNGEKCWTCIRFLFYKAESALQRAINAFVEEAMATEPGWQTKRFQEFGTLPGESLSQRRTELLLKHLKLQQERAEAVTSRATRSKTKSEALSAQSVSTSLTPQPGSHTTTGLLGPVDVREPTRALETSNIAITAHPSTSKNRPSAKNWKQKKLSFQPLTAGDDQPRYPPLPAPHEAMLECDQESPSKKAGEPLSLSADPSTTLARRLDPVARDKRDLSPAAAPRSTKRRMRSVEVQRVHPADLVRTVTLEARPPPIKVRSLEPVKANATFSQRGLRPSHRRPLSFTSGKSLSEVLSEPPRDVPKPPSFLTTQSEIAVASTRNGVGGSFSTVQGSANTSFTSVGTGNDRSMKPPDRNDCATPRLSLNRSFRHPDDPVAKGSFPAIARSDGQLGNGNGNGNADTIIDLQGPQVTSELPHVGQIPYPWPSLIEAAPVQTSNAAPAASKTTTGENLRQRLSKQPPIGDMAERLGKLPLRLRYELLRLSQWTEVPVADIYTKELDSSDPYASIWKRLTQTEALRGKELPPPSNPEAWDRAGDEFDQVVMSGHLTYKKRGAQDVFGLRLNPLRLDHSHRLGRRFGFDRFFRLLLPLPGDRDSMDWLRCDSDTARETVIDWLATTSHGILGRKWKALWIDDHATRTRGKAAVRKEEAKEILLFAEDGLDFRRSRQKWPTKGEAVKAHTSLRVEDMIDWFMGCDQNRDSGYLKLFARISQGLSKTVKTVVFAPSQILWREEDIKSPTNPDEVMNNGCDIISAAAARQVARILNIDGPIPSAFQARIAGAKGVWIVDPRDTYDSLPTDASSIFISITPSQVKFKSDPVDLECKADRDTEDRVTFEVLKYSSGVCSRTLNTELITILDAQGVRRATFELHLRRYLSATIEEQKDAIRDRLLFRKWVHDKYSSIAKEDHAARSGSIPAARSDQMSLLLDAGFHPQECHFLNQLAQLAFKEQCERLRDRYRIPLGRSAYTFCVPDMTQTLEEGTVHLAFSRMFVDEASGFQGTALEDIDILVARHPANRPFDVQKVRAVANPALSRLKDVIVFPTKGRMPLAQKLSGGDYDGDEVWICWEPDIVSQFHNADEPTEPAIEELGITRETTKFCDLGPREDVNGAISEMLRKSFHFCAGREMLGTCTNYYRRLCYTQMSLRDKGQVWVASLLGHLVDRKKQGNRFTLEDWERLRARKDLVPKPPREPAYSSGDKNKQSKHVLDFLRFKVMEPVVEEASRQLHHHGHCVKDFDEDLVRYWKRAKEDATSDSKVKAVLEKLAADVKSMKENWGCQLGARIDAGQQPEFMRIVRQMYERFNKLLPAKAETGDNDDDEQPVISRWRARADDNQYSEWKLLRAAAAYSDGGSYHNTFCWYMAGTQLAYIKCISTGRMRTVDQEMYASYKPDAKSLRNRMNVQSATGAAASNEYWDSDDDDDDDDDYGSITFSEFDSVMPR